MSETKAKYRTSKGAPPPKPIAELRLIQFDTKRRILAGHDSSSDAVFVLRKDDADRWHLYRLDVPEADQAIRSFVTADDSELMELHAAIADTMPRPKRTRRKVKG